MRVPGQSDARAESAIERVVGVLAAVPDVADQGKPNCGIEHLALQGSVLALVQVGFGVNRLIGLID